MSNIDTEKAVHSAVNNSHIKTLEEKISDIIGEEDKSKCRLFADYIRHASDEVIKNSQFVESYVKGEFKKGKLNSFIDEYVKDNEYILSDEKYGQLYGIIHEHLMSALSIVKIFRYIMCTFPLYSKLKRLLLQERTPGEKQWEYAIRVCGDYKENENEYKKANGYYKNISNTIAADTIAAIVDHEIGSGCQFKNTISQPHAKRGWFPNGFGEPPGQHDAKKETLFILAYAFGISLEGFDELCVGSAESTWNVYSPFEDAMRFGLKYKMKYSKALEFAEMAKEECKNCGMEIKYEDAMCFQKKIITFFNESNFDDISALKTQFIQLLKENGADSKCNERLELMRQNKAKEYMIRLLNSIDISAVKNKYKEEYSKMDHYNNETVKYLSDLLKEICNDSTLNPCGINPYDVMCIIEKNTYNLSKLKCKSDDVDSIVETKIKAIKLMCDGRSVEHKDVASKAFSKPVIEALLSGSEIPKSKLHREHILRIAYLTVLNESILGKVNDEKIIERFTDVSNKLLGEMFFHPLQITFPLDAIMCISLKSKYCKSQIYQAFMPHKEK